MNSAFNTMFTKTFDLLALDLIALFQIVVV